MGQKHTAVSSEIDLSGKSEGDWPATIQPRDFQRLKGVDLSSNGLVAIPSTVSAQMREAPRICQTLVSLDLSRNKFTSLPEELCLLVSLTSLRLDENPLKNLPIVFSSMFKLEKFTVSNCQLEYLPPNMSLMKNLKDLRVNGNNLKYLPSDIGNIPGLKRLMIQDNPLPGPILDYYFLSDTKNLQVMIAAQKMPKQYKELQEQFTKTVQEMGLVIATDKADPMKGERFEIFRSMLENVDCITAFRKHLQKEHAAENIDFFDAVTAFRAKYPSATEITTAECVADAEKIYDQFLHDGAPHLVNLPVGVKKKVDQIYQDTYKYPAGVNQWIFNECQSTIVQLMFTDSLKRFTDTQEGKELWAKREKAWRKGKK